MKINEIIFEGFARGSMRPTGYEDKPDPKYGDPEIGVYDDGIGEPEMELSSNADSKMINTVRKVCDMYKGQGHAQVELLPFLTKVMEIFKKPVNLADLIAINKKSPEIQALVDTIDEKKVKFKNMSVKNEDPNKDKEKGAATVASMASRAANRK